MNNFYNEIKDLKQRIINEIKENIGDKKLKCVITAPFNTGQFLKIEEIDRDYVKTKEVGKMNYEKIWSIEMLNVINYYVQSKK